MRALGLHLIRHLMISTLIVPVAFTESRQSLKLSANFLFPTKGVVKVLHDGWKTPIRATFGTILGEKDTVILDGSAEALVVCSDLTVQRLNHIIELFPCPPVKPSTEPEPSTEVVPIRGKLLTILTPRNTNIAGTLDERIMPFLGTHRQVNLLTIIWTPVAGVAKYEVSLDGPGVKHTWVLSTTQAEYPLNKLRLGASYSLSISDPLGNLPGDSAQFHMLSGSETYALRAVTRKIAEFEIIDPAIRGFLLAKFFEDSRVLATAAQVLENVPSPKPPAVLRMLGEIYSEVGLTSRAEEFLRESLAATEHFEDMEDKVLANEILGNFYSSFKYEPMQSLKYFKAAEEAYCINFGAQRECDNTKQRIAKLQPAPKR